MTKKKGSALKIIEYLIARKKPVTLDIQREMVDQKLELLDTGAGSELASEVETLIKHYESRLRKLEQEIIEARDRNKKEDREILEESKKENQEGLARQQQEILNLRISAEQMIEVAKKRAEETEMMIRENLKRMAEDQTRVAESHAQELEKQKVLLQKQIREKYLQSMQERCAVM
jgi:hypothetical protein